MENEMKNYLIDMQELSTFEQFVLSISQIDEIKNKKWVFKKSDKQKYLSKINQLLMKKTNKKIKPFALYVLKNPLLESKPNIIILTGDISNEYIRIFMVCEIDIPINENELIVYSSTLKTNLIVETWNHYDIPIDELRYGELIECVQGKYIKKHNKMVLRQEMFPQQEFDDYEKAEMLNLQLSLPYLHLKENISLSMNENVSILDWVIDLMPNTVFGSINDEKNTIKQNIAKLRNCLEIKIDAKSAIILKIKNDIIIAKLIGNAKTKITANGIILKNDFINIDKVKNIIKKGITIKASGGKTGDKFIRVNAK